MPSARETAMVALATVLGSIAGPVFARNAEEPETVPPGGLILLRDGEQLGRVAFSPASYSFTHQAELIVQTQHAQPSVRDALIDDLLAAIVVAIEADTTLGGTVNRATLELVAIDTEAIPGAAAIKTAVVAVELDYETDSPLG